MNFEALPVHRSKLHEYEKWTKKGPIKDQNKTSDQGMNKVEQPLRFISRLKPI